MGIQVDWTLLRQRLQAGDARDEVLKDVVIEVPLDTFSGRLAIRQLAYAAYAMGEEDTCNEILAVVGKDG